jgi:hypothetical protein
VLFVGLTWFSAGITELFAGLFDLLKQNLMFLPYLMRCVLLLQHEEGSVQMFEYLLEKNGLHSVVVDYCPELKDKAIEFIKELIRGEGTMIRNKKYLYQVYLHDFVYEVCICSDSALNECAGDDITRMWCCATGYLVPVIGR